MDEAELLEKAAARVEQGWGQGAYLDCDGNVCAVGAMCYALYNDAEHYSARRSASYTQDPLFMRAAIKLLHVLDEQFDCVGHPYDDVLSEIIGYNDSLIASKGELVAYMEKAAAGLREGGD